MDGIVGYSLKLLVNGTDEFLAAYHTLESDGTAAENLPAVNEGLGMSSQKISLLYDPANDVKRHPLSSFRRSVQ